MTFQGWRRRRNRLQEKFSSPVLRKKPEFSICATFAQTLSLFFFQEFDAKDIDSVRKAIKYSNVVINCMGKQTESGLVHFTLWSSQSVCCQFQLQFVSHWVTVQCNCDILFSEALLRTIMLMAYFLESWLKNVFVWESSATFIFLILRQAAPLQVYWPRKGRAIFRPRSDFYSYTIPPQWFQLFSRI